MYKTKMILALLLALIVTVEAVSYRRDAQALAIEASIVASVCVIMTACGLSYWAATQSDAQSFIAGKLQYYLSEQTSYSSLSEWLGISSGDRIFTIVRGSILKYPAQVANKVLAFARWLTSTYAIESGGEPLEDYELPSGLTVYPSGYLSATMTETNVLSIRLSDAGDESNFARTYMFIRVPCVSGYTCTATVSDSNLYAYCTWGLSADMSEVEPTIAMVDGITQRLNAVGDYIYIKIYNHSWPYIVRHCTISVQLGEPLTYDTIASITPSDTVSIPADLGDAEDLVVSTNAPIGLDYTQDQADQAIYDTIASPDGLTSSADTQLGVGEGWSWLDTAIGTITDLLGGISEALQPEYSEIDAYTLDLTTVFPFCIPWDVYRGLYLLDAEPITPRVIWDMPLPSALGGGVYRWDINLSSFDGVAALLRHMELLAFAIGLMVETKRLVKW